MTQGAGTRAPAGPAPAPASAVIADDEPQLAAYLEKLLQACWPQLEVVGRAANGEQALQMIRALRPDVAFLDIQMPGLTGLDVAARLAAAGDGAGADADSDTDAQDAAACRLVFVTAFDQYAIEAFERAAVDYLLKPVTAERLARTVERLRDRRPADKPVLAVDELRRLVERLRGDSGYLHWLQVSVKDEITMLPVAEVDLFQSSDKYTLASNRQGEWLLRTALKELEPQLDPQAFWRIHRSAVVRVAAIERVSRDLRGQFVVHLKGHARKLAVSRPYAHRFRAL
jgi:DNA-binding LytR/AlgR family response regulator